MESWASCLRCARLPCCWRRWVHRSGECK
jgi:hypothetical protein